MGIGRSDRGRHPARRPHAGHDHRLVVGDGPRPTYYRLVRDRFEDDVMPSFSNIQFEISLSPTSRTRLTLFGLAGRETLLEEMAQQSMRRWSCRRAATPPTSSAPQGKRWTPSCASCAPTTLSGYAFGRPRRQHVAGPVADVRIQPAHGIRKAAPPSDVITRRRRTVIDAGVDFHVVRGPVEHERHEAARLVARHRARAPGRAHRLRVRANRLSGCGRARRAPGSSSASTPAAS